MKPRRKAWKGLAALGLIGMVIYAGVSLRGAIQTYVTFAEAKEMKGTVRVAIFVDHKTRRFDPVTGALEFRATDTKGESCLVRFLGVPPAGFEQTPMAVIAGRYRDGIFEADQIFLKCPSKYEGMDIGREGEGKEKGRKASQEGHGPSTLQRGNLTAGKVL